MSNILGQPAADTAQHMVDREEIGRRLKAARLARGWTVREAAPKCGISYQTLNGIENGTNTTIATLERISEALGIAVEVLVHTEDDVDAGGSQSGLARRFLAVLPRIPQEELDVFVHELALWERRYGSENSD